MEVGNETPKVVNIRCQKELKDRTCGTFKVDTPKRIA